MRFRIMIFAFAVVLTGCAPADPVEVDPRTSPPEVVGHTLRLAIDAEYARLVETDTFKMPTTFITPTVERLIPIGSSFERAELVLRGAGLTIDPSRNYETLWPDSYALRGRIDGYSQSWRLLSVCRQTLSIALSPQAEMHSGSKKTIDPASVDWSQIRRIEASIFNICL